MRPGWHPLACASCSFSSSPLFRRHEINAPNLDLFIDISTKRMHKLKHSTAADHDDPEVAVVIAEDQVEDNDTNSDDKEET